MASKFDIYTSALNVYFLLLLGFTRVISLAEVAFLSARIWLTSVDPSRSLLGQLLLKEGSSPIALQDWA